ncbi:MAG TPA: UDP-glucuronic acid decarboxylase family protein [Candidatus Tripitaka californicus]|uniref:UDP-glucuronic acid decarboxylase family protein n=1 Tax=Candidatus Tripitaka californicus TaxID=3367616 RepID=UPI004029FDF7|nr:SDR family oxidoreductase [Planctomycetota bacterium]
MQMVITGGAGFIGSHLCKYLLNKGHSVVCIDNLCTGSEDNFPSPSGTREFKFIKHDVTEKIYLEGDIDCVLHLASPASPVDYHRLPIQTLKAGALGTLMALGLAKHKKARFLLASTSEVYGDPLVHPQVETYWGNVNPIGPRAVYDEAKRFAEALTMAYHRVHGIDTRIARIFNTYGPGMRLDDGRALPTFISQALKGEDLTVFGSGEHTRSFCYISDMVEGLYKLLLSKEHEPVNLGNPEEVSILQLAREVAELSSSKSKLIFKPLPEDDPKVRRPDISKAKRLLNWEPKVGRREGFLETIEHFARRLRGQGVGVRE